MKIKRTDGGGEFFTDERLKSVKGTLNFLKLTDKIYELHDHKGNLNVYWKVFPTESEMETVENVWESYHEYIVDHFFTHSELIKSHAL
jgi:hypothetical protein